MKIRLKRIWKMKHFEGAIIFVLFLTFGVVSIMQPDTAYAEAHQSTITLGANINTLSINLRPSVSGSFDKSADCIINVRTDNFTGYTLSIASASQDPDHATSLTDGNGNYIESITSNVSEADFKNSANTQYNNKWGYKPSQYIQSGTVIPNENYLPSPSLNGNILDITSSANTVDNTYTITLGARIDSNIPAGTYANDFIVYAVANDIVYNINYNKNTEDTVNNMPSPNPQVVTIEGGTSAAESYATLSNNTPTRTGYTFAGWCDSATTLDTNTGNQVCSTTTYQPNTDYGIDQTAGPNVVLYAIWTLNTYNITIGTSTGISNINVLKDNTNVCSISGSNLTVCQLKYNTTYDIIATTNTGYSFNEWQNTTATGSFGDTTLATTTFTPGLGAATLTATATANTYNITLNGNGATNTPTSSTTATYGSTTLANIATLPTKSNTTGTRTISGFTLGTGATNANVTYNSTQATGSTCSSASNCTSTNSTSYTFNGWHQTSDNSSTLIASSAATPALQASTTYTNSSSQWTDTSNNVTLYAGWNSSAGSYSSVTLPTIEKTGYSCHWNTNSSDTGTTYNSGASVTPGSNLTLTGFCTANNYNLTINFAGSGVSSVQVRTASGTGGTLTGAVSTSGGSVSLTYGNTYYIYPVYSNGYEYDSIAKASGTGTLGTGSNPTWVVGAGAGTVTVTGKSSCTAVSGYMQDFTGTATYCSDSGTLTDKRDSKPYTVAKINGAWWMTQNLNFTDTSLNTSTSNVTSDKTLTWYDLEGTEGSSSSGHCYGKFRYNSSYDVIGVSGDGLTYLCKHTSSTSSYGTYYNYAGATAGTITGTSNTTESSQDICPKGWRLPTHDEQSSVTDSSSAFSPVYSGRYLDGNLGLTGTHGYWWSSTASDAYSRYRLYYGDGSLYPNNGIARWVGMSIRCVHSS